MDENRRPAEAFVACSSQKIPHGVPHGFHDVTKMVIAPDAMFMELNAKSFAPDVCTGVGTLLERPASSERLNGA